CVDGSSVTRFDSPSAFLRAAAPVMLHSCLVGAIVLVARSTGRELGPRPRISPIATMMPTTTSPSKTANAVDSGVHSTSPRAARNTASNGLPGTWDGDVTTSASQPAATASRIVAGIAMNTHCAAFDPAGASRLVTATDFLLTDCPRSRGTH